MKEIALSVADAESAEAVFERRIKTLDGVIDNYHSYLRLYLFGLTHQWQDAENLLQDLWRYVLMNFEEDKIGEVGLLRRKAYQLFVDHYRRLVRRGETLVDEAPERPSRFSSSEAFTEAEEIAFRKKFWSEYPAIDLTNGQKEALWLHARYGYTYKEIEGRLGVPNSTVCDWVAHARTELAKAMNN